MLLELDEFIIDAYSTELILNDSNSFTVLLGQNSVEKCGLTRPQEAGQDGDGDLPLVLLGESVPF